MPPKMPPVLPSSTTADAEEREIRAFVMRMHDQNRLHEVFEVLNSNFDMTTAPQPMQPAQAMTDASKRRRSPNAPEPWEVVQEQGIVTPGPRGSRPTSSTMSAAPMAGSAFLPTEANVNNPQRAGYIPADYEPVGPVDLPEGISSFRQWGSTVCVLPKVSKLRLNYRELVTKSYQDDDLRKYLTNFILTHQGNSEKVHDLKRYLIAIRYNGSHEVIRYGGGTSEARVFKD